MFQLEKELKSISQQRSNLLDLRDSCFERVQQNDNILSQNTRNPVKVRQRKKISLQQFNGQNDACQNLSEFKSYRETVFYKPYNYQKNFNEKSQLFDKSFEILNEVSYQNSNLLNLQEISSIKDQEQRSFFQSNKLDKSSNNLLSSSFNIISKQNKSVIQNRNKQKQIQNVKSLLNYAPEKSTIKQSIFKNLNKENNKFKNRCYNEQDIISQPLDKNLIQRQIKQKAPIKNQVEKIAQKIQRKSVSFKRGNQTVVIEQTAIYQAICICLLVAIVLYYNIISEYKNIQFNLKLLYLNNV